MRRHPLRSHPLRRHPLRSHSLRSHPLRSHPLRSHPLRSHPLRSHPLRRAAVLLAALTTSAACSAPATSSGEGQSSGPAAGSTSASTAAVRPTTTTGTTKGTTATTTGQPDAGPTGTTQPPEGTASPEQQAQAVLDGLDRRKQVAQLFVVGVPLDGPAAGDGLAAGGIGGLFLAGRSTMSAAALARVTGRWADSAPGSRPWVAADQEGGLVQTLSGPGFDTLPSAVVQGGLPPARLRTLADGMGASLADAGINLDLAPVADVVPAGTEAGNAPIGHFDRQYGSTAAAVRAAAGTVVDGLAAHGVTATLKHFPGLGRVTGNTDTSADVTDTVTGPADPQVRLFGDLAGGDGHPFVMTSSATYTRIDAAHPAAWSPAVIGDLLRTDLGFDGVIISDDLGNAAAVSAVAPGERAVRFLEAGGTLVLTVAAQLYPQMRDAVLARDRRDVAFSRTVDAAVRTALVAKARAGLLPPG